MSKIKVRYKGPLKRVNCRRCAGYRFFKGKVCDDCHGSGTLLLRTLLPVSVYDDKSFTPSGKPPMGKQGSRNTSKPSFVLRREAKDDRIMRMMDKN